MIPDEPGENPVGHLLNQGLFEATLFRFIQYDLREFP